jgi:hypothetical protein
MEQLINPNTKLEQFSTIPQVANLGPVRLRTDIRSNLGPFQVLPEYEVRLPETVKLALISIFREFNGAFAPMIDANREFESDYRFGMESGKPVNFAIQIDMAGLPDGFLEAAPGMGFENIVQILKGNIFEIENSIAMYTMLQNMFTERAETGMFNLAFRGLLDRLRSKFGKKIALLAVTEDKYEGMLGAEFGKQAGERVTDDDVMAISGFDRFFGPADFLQHLEATGGESDFLLFVRSSHPVAKLKKPDLLIEHPLLENSEVRRIIKANCITFNIDRPDLPVGDNSRINDSKEYLLHLGMAHRVDRMEDLSGADFAAFMARRGVDPGLIQTGGAPFRLKPMRGSYGCFGQHKGPFKNSDHRNDFKRDLARRGPYVVQPEIPATTVFNLHDGKVYGYIERIFLGTDGRNYGFLGGVRLFLPADSHEAQQGRFHGSKEAVSAQIF